jgi:hypothetical protein
MVGVSETLYLWVRGGQRVDWWTACGRSVARALGRWRWVIPGGGERRTFGDSEGVGGKEGWYIRRGCCKGRIDRQFYEGRRRASYIYLTKKEY